MVTPEHRRQAKVVNFGIVYGLSAFGLSQQLGIEPAEAKQFIAAYFEKYKGVRAFIDQTLEEARREQKVRTLFGRVRPIPDINSKNANLRGFADKFAADHKVDLPFVVDPQGKLAAEVNADRALGSRIGIHQTPTIYVVSSKPGGKPYVEVTDRTQLFQIIDAMK